MLVQFVLQPLSYWPATGVASPFLTDIGAAIVAGAIIAYFCFRLKLVPIIGFLLAGVLIGPYGLGIVGDHQLIDSVAELGVILLLFTIGIEFSLEKLGRIQRLIFGGGGLQVVLACGATTLVLRSFGVGWRPAIFTGFLVALSSTAIVLKLLADRGETNDTHGQVSLGLLIFQDLAVIVMVLLVPILSGNGGTPLAIVWALAKALGIIVIVLVGARSLMPKVLEKVALTCSPELFLLSVIAICFSTAYLTSLAGVSLSLGAFLAGLLVSESRFSEHALGETMPLQILFSATFFVSVGMLLDVRFLVRNLLFVFAVVALVVLIKTITTGISVFALGYRLPVVVITSLMLAQVGEFSFVLERTGRESGLFPTGLAGGGSQYFIATTVVLMILTPFLSQFGSYLSVRLERKKAAFDSRKIERLEPLPEDIPRLSNHVIVAGYGDAARRLVHVLTGSGIPFIITTLSPTGANEAEELGLNVVRGDASKQRLLTLVGIEQAKMLVVADDDSATALRIASVARALNDTLRVVVRSRYIADIETLSSVGVDRIIAEELEAIVQLFAEVLRNYEIPPEQIEATEAIVRSGGYKALLNTQQRAEEPLAHCDITRECLETRTIRIRARARAAKQQLTSLGLATNFGLHLKKIARNGGRVDHNEADVVLEPGDELTLSGPHEAFAAAAELFRIEEEVSQVTVATNGGRSKPPLADFIDAQLLIDLTEKQRASGCIHAMDIHPVMPRTRGCEECLELGERWVQLRLCMSCGHVGCCDSSKNMHARGHNSQTTHPIIKSIEPGESWAWCYSEERYL